MVVFFCYQLLIFIKQYDWCLISHDVSYESWCVLWVLVCLMSLDVSYESWCVLLVLMCLMSLDVAYESWCVLWVLESWCVLWVLESWCVLWVLMCLMSLASTSINRLQSLRCFIFGLPLITHMTASAADNNEAKLETQQMSPFLSNY